MLFLTLTPKHDSYSGQDNNLRDAPLGTQEQQLPESNREKVCYCEINAIASELVLISISILFMLSL